MKTKILSLALMSLWSLSYVCAQDRTTVAANNSDISDNLDLRAVASIFGDSRDLSDFERRLNDPNSRISNLDLNGDNRVDYLRVIETIEGNAHVVIIQSVLGRDNYQDVATVEVERDRYNRVQVQVVGDVYMYGNNYIYEPVYAYTPVIYSSFWAGNYRPYYSSWYWGYYPNYYAAWSPFPIYSYYDHIGMYINFNHHYNYSDFRRCSVAYNNYYTGRRGNWYERQYPARSFSNRNTGYANRYELDNNRRSQTATTRNQVAPSGFRSNSTAAGSPRSVRTQGSEPSPRTYGSQSNESPRTLITPKTRTELSIRTYGNQGSITSPRSTATSNTRTESSVRTYGNQINTESPRTVATPSTRAENIRTYGNQGSTGSPRTVASPSTRTYGNQRTFDSPESVSNQYGSPRSETTPRTYGNTRINSGSPANSSPRDYSQQRGSSQNSEGNSRGISNRRS